VAANADDPKSKDLSQAILFALEAEHLKGSGQSKQAVRLALTAVLRARPAGADERVRKFLAYTDPDIVADALNTLARLRAKNANRDARDLLETHVHAIVRANAARVLAAAEDKEAVDVLIKAATGDGDTRVRVSSIRALAALKDARAADPLLARGEKLLAAYTKSFKPGFQPAEHNEFLEIAVALGRVLANTDNQRADKLLGDFAKMDKGHSPEVYIARVRIWPRRSDGKSEPELKDWRQYSSIAQVVGEFAAIEPTSEVGKQMKAEAPGIIRPLAKAYAVADPEAEAANILAAPDAIRAFARFKTDDLAEVLRDALKNKDIFIRATAAELIADLPVSTDNLDALNAAFDYAIANDTRYDDAILSTMEALYKLDKRKSLTAVAVASAWHDHIVRRRALAMLRDDAFNGVEQLPPLLKYADEHHLNRARPHTDSATKLGQVLNTQADYRRAAARKNGTVKAVLTMQKGTFTIDLLPEDAPLTVDNFIKLANARYFDGLEVHRVVPNFVMQDGDPRGDGNGGPGWSIRCEINMVPYERGAVGMALSGKDTGGSQWFVTHSPQPHLDGGYTVFGRVNETGMKVVDNIVRGDKIVTVTIIETKSQRKR
jgi:cyclophilin family peptidyl-prolyl cis-trans isomerase/HEAT repeat protein